MFLNMKEAIKVLFKGKQVIVLTEFDEKLGGILVCKPDGKFAIKRLDGTLIDLWLSSMRFIGEDGFEVYDCKGADRSSSILLEKGLAPETRDSLDKLENQELIQYLLTENAGLKELKVKNEELIKRQQGSIDRADARVKDVIRSYERHEYQIKKEYSRSYRVGDPHDLLDITSALLFNQNRSGANRLFRKDPFEEFALIQQKNGAVGILSDFHSVYRVG